MVLFSFFTLCFFIDFFSILHEKSDNQKNYISKEIITVLKKDKRKQIRKLI